MTEWIKGRELLEPPHNLTRRQIYNAVRDGALVPYISPDGDKTNRVWRFLPPKDFQESWGHGEGEIQEKYKNLICAQYDLDRFKSYARKSDAQHIWEQWAFNKYLPNDTRHNLPAWRQRWEDKIKKSILTIELLEKELAPERIWKDLDLGPAQKDSLLEKLLDASYDEEQAKPFLAKYLPKQAISDGRPQKMGLCKSGTKWEEIVITLIAEEAVRINTPDWERRYSYHELDLSDKRKGDTPTELWELLKLFAKMNGFISSEMLRNNSKLPNKAKRLNKHLKEFFGINESIYSGDYRKEKGYRTKITFRDQTFPQGTVSKVNSSSQFTCQGCKTTFDPQKNPEECPVCYRPIQDIEAIFVEAKERYEEAIQRDANKK